MSTGVNAPAQRHCLLFRFEQYQLCHHLRLQQFYDRLLAALRAPAMHDGDLQLLQYAPAWDGNWTPDCFIAYFWQGADNGWNLVVVNYAAISQCYIETSFPNLRDQQWRLEDLPSDVR